MKNKLETDVQFLPGVGPRRASLLRSELEVATIGDLLHLFPFRYIDRSSIQKIADIRSTGSYVQILGEVTALELTGQGNRQRLSVIVRDSSGEMELVFFKATKYIAERLRKGSVFLFFGKPSTFNGKLNMVHPEIDAPPSEGAANYPGVLTGVYPSTEKLRNGGITVKVINRLMSAAIEYAIPDIAETLPEYILREKGLPSLRYAIRNIHFPSDQTALAKAQYRLKWEELFLLQLSLV